MKKERATMSDESRERLLIAEQIERAAAEAEAGPSSSPDSPPVEEGLKREEGAEKVVLSFSAKPVTAAAPSTASTSMPAMGFKMNPLKPATNPLKANPLKRPNVFKTSADGTDATKSNGVKRPAPAMTAAERLIIEEQERKKRRLERDGIQ